MSKVPTPTPQFISGTDVTDEIRRHLRTLDIITRRGDGETILAGNKVQVSNTDPAQLQEDIQKALDEMKALSDSLAFRKAQSQNE